MNEKFLNKHVILIGAATMLFLLALISSNTAAGELFMTSDDCAFCHTSSSTALVDSRGNDLSIAHDWGSTMMANSFRDPIFRAKMESEKKRNAHLSGVIEDKCLTCHTPMARIQYIQDQKGYYRFAADQSNGLAEDGVSCTLCHQIQATGLGARESFSGKFTINGNREIFGPYKDVFGNPMRNQVGYQPVFGRQVHESALCGSCHTLFTPYVDNSGQVAGEFPEQTPYLEWLNSSYAPEESGRSCQDCHMPRVEEPIKISNRPPWLKNQQSPFWKHHFTGGNVFALEMMRLHPEQTGITASDDDFRLTIKRTEQRLTGEAISLSLDAEKAAANQLRVKVRVKNRTGHKFPTGFPSRRAWLQLMVQDNKGNVLFNSGNWNEHGEIIGLDSGFEPHHEMINAADQVQVYQAIMADVDSKQTSTLMRAAGYLKDNRLTPRGYLADGPMTEYTKIYGGAVNDENFNKEDGKEGSGADIVTYEIHTDQSSYPLTIETRLLYQTVTPRFIADLLADDIPATRKLESMYSAMDRRPVVLESVSTTIK